MVRRQSCSNIFALVHIFFIIDNAFITSTLSLKKISQINQMNRQNVLSNIPIDKHVRLTSKSKTHKKRQWKYHILVVSCISNEKYNANIMNMINIDIQHVMIHVINTCILLSVLIDKEPFYFHQVCISSPHRVYFRPKHKERWYK